MSLTRQEKETILRFSEDPEEGLRVYTCSAALKRRMDRFKAKLLYCTNIEGREAAWCYLVPVDWFRSPGPKSKKTLSPEQREAIRDRLQKARS